MVTLKDLQVTLICYLKEEEFAENREVGVWAEGAALATHLRPKEEEVGMWENSRTTMWL